MGTNWRGTAFHGTSVVSATSIVSQKKFNPSSGKEHDRWLGAGCYFFLDDVISEPTFEIAKKWAIVEAYNSISKTNNYTEGSVVSIEVESEDELVFDLRIPALIQRFNLFRSLFEQKVKVDGNTKKFTDGAICAELVQNHGIKLIINHFYIKLDGWSRHKRIESNVPNCVVLCVTLEGLSGLKFDTIKIVDTFAIS
jgi:hypothetical protein